MLGNLEIACFTSKCLWVNHNGLNNRYSARCLQKWQRKPSEKSNQPITKGKIGEALLLIYANELKTFLFKFREKYNISDGATDKLE